MLPNSGENVVNDSIEARIQRNREEALRRLQKKRAHRLTEVTSLDTTAILGISKLDKVLLPKWMDLGQKVSPESLVIQRATSQSEGSVDKSVKKLPKRIMLRMQFLSRETFEIKCDYRKELVDYFRTIQGSRYDVNTCAWIIPFELYGSIIKILESKLSEISMELQPIPKSVLASINKEQLEEKCDPFDKRFDLTCLEPKLKSYLLPFQLEGVRFALKKKGRVLIGDDMGLGKTIQAIAIAITEQNGLS
jgi:SNF2 family DNA or RNA helicase